MAIRAKIVKKVGMYMKRFRFVNLSEVLDYIIYVMALGSATLMYLLASNQFIYGIMLALSQSIELSIKVAFSLTTGVALTVLVKSYRDVIDYKPTSSKTGRFFIDVAHDGSRMISAHAQTFSLIVFSLIILSGHAVIRDSFLRNMIISYVLTFIGFFLYHNINDDMFEWSELFYARQNKKD